jgi:hypothetical protein
MKIFLQSLVAQYEYLLTPVPLGSTPGCNSPSSIPSASPSAI